MTIALEEKQKRMMMALKTSPLGVSVCAWRKQGDVYVKSKNERDNHWTVCVVGYVKDKYWLIADTYIDDGEPIKKLSWDYPFSYCKRYSIELKPMQPKPMTLLEQIREYLCKSKYWKSCLQH